MILAPLLFLVGDCLALVPRRSFLGKFVVGGTGLGTALVAGPSEVVGKCTDIESCREIGNKKVEEADLKNPTFKLGDGVRYKVLQSGFGNEKVDEDSVLDITFSISSVKLYVCPQPHPSPSHRPANCLSLNIFDFPCSFNFSFMQAGGSYFYSQGFGYEKDLGETYRVTMGAKDVPVGIELALQGMRRGERRRIELPPAVGFETSGWKPEPSTRRGRASIVGYRQVLEGNGSSQPPFPAETLWDVEVSKIRARTAVQR